MRKYLVAIFFALAAVGCSTEPKAIEFHESGNQPRKNRVFIISHGWHTGVVLPAKDLLAKIPALKRRFTRAESFEIGWGDKGFYQANEITTGLTLRAMFWSPGAVLHVVAVPGDARTYFEGSEIRRLCLSDAALASLVSFLESSFQKTPQNEVIEMQRGLYGDSQFYDGVGRYHMFNTCNKWTAKAVRSSGVDISTALKLTSGSVMRSIEDRSCD